LTDLASELERQSTAKRDFVAPTTKLEMLPDTRIRLTDTGDFAVREYAHGQISGYTGIPKPYYDKMRAEEPRLLADNVNTWLHKNPERRMVRTLDGNMRALLSERYRPLDNHDLAIAAFETLKDKGLNIEHSSFAVTETKLYMKFVTPKIEHMIVPGRHEYVAANEGKGHLVQAGIVISNSEVGAGSVKIEPMLFWLRCLNGLIVADASLRKFHVGKGFGNGNGEQVEAFFKDETRRADDAAFFMKVRDLVRGVFDSIKFGELVERVQSTTTEKIDGDPVKAVEQVAIKWSLKDEDRKGIFKRLIEGADLSRYGLLNAVTRHSQDVDSYEDATTLERLGGEIVELSPTDWKAIATAA